MSWKPVSDIAAQLVAQHSPRPSDVEMVEAMITDAQVKDPEAVGAPFLAQAITELLTPMAA
jgi:hypothetical protein